MDMTREKVELLRSDGSALYGEPDVDGRLKVDGPLPVMHVSEDAQEMTYHVTVAALVAAVGGVLFGYDVGIVSAALLQLKVEFDLSCVQQSLVVSTMLVGAVIGSLIGGFILDRFGRRDALVFNALLFILGGVVLAFTQSFTLLLFGRMMVGFAVALAAVAECIYISELSPSNSRGRLVSLNELAITIGFLLAYFIGYLFISVNHGWRYMFGLSAVPALLQAVFLLFLPKSPRFLMLKQREKEAYNVLCRLRGSRQVDNEIRSIKTAIQLEQSHSVVDLLSRSDNMRGRMFIGVGLILFQQLTGQPNVLYFAPTIFQSLGFRSDSAATLATVGLGIVKVVSTTLSVLFVDRIGRRHFLLTGIALMALSIFVLGVATLALDTGALATDVCRDNGTEAGATEAPSEVTATSLVAKWLAFICLMLYVLAYAFSFGPGTWLILSEIFPATVRGRAISIATVLNWSSSLLVSMTFLQLLGAIGVSLLFIIYSVVSCLAFVFTFSFVPETRNKSLEQISADLTRGSLTKRMLANLKSCCRQGNVYLSVNSDDLAGDTGNNDVT